MEKTQALVEKGKNLGADEVIACTTLMRRGQIRFSNNEIDISKIWNDYSTEIVLTWQKRVVATEIKNFEKAEERVENLYKLAKVTNPNPIYGGIASGTYTYKKRKADKDIYTLEEPTTYVERAIEAARTCIPKDLNAGGALYTKYEDIYLSSSEGPEGRDARSSIELSIRAFSQKEASGHGVECSSSLKGFEPERAGKKAGEIANLAKDPIPGVEGTYDVVLDPLIAGSFLGSYGMMASAFYAMIQMSIFGNKIGQRVAPEHVTIRDNPASYSVANRLFDDEGVPTSETIIIDEGILKTFLHNTSTSKTFNADVTGNAGLVVPQAWNLELDQGDSDRDELFETMEKGLYLTNTWYTRFQNYSTGDFSTIPRDGSFIVENGEISGPIKDIRISDNMLRILGAISRISKERQHVNWWESMYPTLSPYILVKDVKITRPT